MVPESDPTLSFRSGSVASVTSVVKSGSGRGSRACRCERKRVGVSSRGYQSGALAVLQLGILRGRKDSLCSHKSSCCFADTSDVRRLRFS